MGECGSDCTGTEKLGYILQDPLHAFLYIIFALGSCYLASKVGLISVGIFRLKTLAKDVAKHLTEQQIIMPGHSPQDTVNFTGKALHFDVPESNFTRRKYPILLIVAPT